MIDDTYSYVIRKLTQNEINDLKSELMLHEQLWAHHIPEALKERLTSLRDGRSIHLKFDIMEGINTNHWSKFPVATEIIRSIADDKPVGRTYWHRLLPGDGIEKHTDENIYRMHGIDTRYQIYLDIPTDSLLFMDNTIQTDKNKFSNSIINFNLRKPHAYKNYSNTTWYFLVFDVMKLTK